MNPDEYVTNSITAILELAVKRQFQLPFRLVVLGSNGSLVYVHYTNQRAGEGLDGHPITSHTVDGLLTFPMNFMVTDADGRVFGARIEEPGKGPEVWRN